MPLAVLTVIAAGRIYSSEVNSAGNVLISELTITVTAAVTAYLAFQIRKVAVVRGYVRRTEQDINKIVGSESFDWSIHCAPDYLGNSWMNYLLPGSLGVAFFVACNVSVQTIIASQECILLVVALLGLSGVVVCLSIFSLFYNDEISERVCNGESIGVWFPLLKEASVARHVQGRDS